MQLYPELGYFLSRTSNFCIEFWINDYIIVQNEWISTPVTEHSSTSSHLY
jgi:hypothetical protein